MLPKNNYFKKHFIINIILLVRVAIVLLLLIETMIFDGMVEAKIANTFIGDIIWIFLLLTVSTLIGGALTLSILILIPYLIYFAYLSKKIVYYMKYDYQNINKIHVISIIIMMILTTIGLLLLPGLIWYFIASY